MYGYLNSRTFCASNSILCIFLIFKVTSMVFSWYLSILLNLIIWKVLDTQALEKSMLYKTDEVYCNNYYTCYYIQVYLECTYFPMNLFFTKKSPCTNIPPSPFFMYDQCHNHSCSQIRIKVEHFSTARSLRNPYPVCVCVCQSLSCSPERLGITM